MNQKNLLHFVFIPAYVLTLITAIRTPLQVLAPDHSITPMFSAVVPMFAMFLLWPILLRKQGLTFGQFLKVHLLALFLVRLPVAAAYGMAIHFQWTEPSGEPVRYITDFDGAGALTGALMAQFAPMVFGVVIGVVVWSIHWALAYRGKQSWGGVAVAG